MFFQAYIEEAEKLFNSYSLQMPLHLYLKEYFKKNKKFGSRDRKLISNLIYGIYRLGNGNPHLSIQEKMASSALLSRNMPSTFFEKCFPDLIELIELSFAEKRTTLETQKGLKLTCPFELSEAISEDEFLENMFSSPRVFIRIRKNKEVIKGRLKANEIEFVEENESCFSFAPNIKLDEILNVEDYVIQDIASQKVGAMFSPSENEIWWDSCAASGGKSIQLLDNGIPIQLVVSDIRKSILGNLDLRMKQYGYQRTYKSYVMDVSKNTSRLGESTFDAIICDIPCSGSGTWARSPEQFYFFSEEKLNAFNLLQKNILDQALLRLKPNGILYYITCSVFLEENENRVTSLSNDFEIVNQFQVGGDAMFVAKIEG